MKVAFVFAPYTHKLFAENLKIVDEDFGVFPPINLAYAAAITEQAGHDVILIDANAEQLEIPESLGRLRAFQPDLVGLYFSTYMFHDTLRWAKAFKDDLNVPIIAGGINILLYPAESLAHRTIDYGLSGEGVKSLPMLLEAIEQEREPTDIPGVCFRRNGETIIQPPSKQLVKFDSYPFPARHLLLNDRYYSITSQLRNFTIMVTTMGCAHNCTFCAIAKIPYRTRSVESVLDEMEECVKRYGVKEIDIFDADFPFIRKRAEQICQGILDRNLDFIWSCRARIDSVDEELLELMYRSGCRKIYFGIETPSEETLQAMKKNITVLKIRETIKNAKKVGIKPLGFFMTGVPGETHTSLLRTIRFALSLNLDFAQFSRTIAKPQTDLDIDLIEKTGEDYWRKYILGEENERRIGSPWTTMDENQIEAWTKCAYYIFYYRPTYIAKAFARIKSFDELKHGIRTAIRMALGAVKFDK